MTRPDQPVLFIHGLWLHATSWTPWIDLFRSKSYQPIAPGWPGEAPTVSGARELPDTVANISIDDLTAHYRTVVDSLDAEPIIIGHSFGGLIAQKLLGQGIGAAAIAIDPAQIKGVLPLPLAQIRAAFPVLGNPANRRKAVSLTEKQFRYAFGNTLTEDESADLYAQWTIPSPGLPLFQGATANFSAHSQAQVDNRNETRGPLLLISGTADHTVPDVVTRSTFKRYHRSAAITELQRFDRGHSLTIDHGWREIADASISWLRGQGL